MLSHNFLTRLKLSQKILLTGIVIAVCFPIPLLVWILPSERTNGYEMREESTRHLVEAAWGILDYYGGRAAAGVMTLEQAQTAARESLRKSRFQNGNYLWINDLHPSMVMHAAKPEMEGQDLSGYHDPDGVAVFLEMTRVCRTRGEGVVRYRWSKPGNPEPSPKVSYVKLYPAWGWIVGAGVYADDIEAALHRSYAFVLSITAAELLASLLLAYGMARGLSTPLRRATASLNQFSEQSTQAVTNVSNASQTIASAMTRQADSLQQTSASLNEMTSQTQKSLAAAQKIEDLVNHVNRAVAEGDERVKEMGAAIQHITASTQQVRNIVGTIDEIAFQTNILAINAAVEAARAREAGAGFGVVADEVRNLAQRASEAAKQTAELTANSLSSAEQGSAIGLKVAESFSRIVGQIQDVRTGLSQITDSFRAGSDEISQINSAVAQISHLIQSQAATSEETARAAEELHAQTVSVRDVTAELTEMVEGTE